MKYKIFSATSVAAVRGTAFSFAVSKKGKTKIKLLHGLVKANPVKKGKVLENKSVDLKAGKKLEISKSAKFKIKKIKKAEKIKLSQLDTIKIIPRKKIEKIIIKQIRKKENHLKSKIENKTKLEENNTNTPKLSEENSEAIVSDNDNMEVQSVNNVIINSMAKKVLIPDYKPTKKVKKNLSLAQLKKKYGKLSKLTTKKGKAYIGILKEKGNGWEIITTNGKYTIAKKEMKNIKTY